MTSTPIIPHRSGTAAEGKVEAVERVNLRTETSRGSLDLEGAFPSAR